MKKSTTRAAVVTGAASGIGQALASLLAERGVSLSLADIDGPALDRVAGEVGAANASIVDVADAIAVQRFADEVGSVDLVCLNAGILSTSTGPPWEASPEDWERVLGVNLHGVVNGLRAFVPLLLEHDGPSHVLITASLAGAITWPGGGAYAASKHAVLAVAEQAALHLADSPISVTVLCPALVKTAMSDIGDDAHSVAALALEAVEAGRFAVIPPTWTQALRARAETLTTGRPPTVPAPDHP
jgi:NADP-dependent 3-hydroxy acid dehydrogenase YdfG